ncbi:MAG: ASKHA domain-containing protein, partial [Candidatus Bathyarchaeia archaeon]
MPIVTILPDGLRIQVDTELTLLEALRRASIQLPAICGGRGICGKCRVRIVKDSLTAPTEAEKKHLDRMIDSGFRLACQAKLIGDTIVDVMQNRASLVKQRLSIIGYEPSVEAKPGIMKVYLKIDKPTLENVKPYESIVREALTKLGFNISSFSLEALRKLPKALKYMGITVTIDGEEVIDIDGGDTRSSLYGLAIDLGSTKIAAFIVDLSTGETLYGDGIVNPQIAYGEDIVSRISYILESEENLEKLRIIVVDAINDLVSSICRMIGVDQNSIYKVTLVGNTAMHHIFYGIDPTSLVYSPYPAVSVHPIKAKASTLGLNVNKSAYIYSPPNIAGFVGADAVADILASRIYESDELTLLLDIGTNTEIVLGDRNLLLCCSAASGPAFEGMEIRYGMKAVEGAIERVKISSNGLNVEYTTIGSVKPRGICGSGIIDAVAEMYRVGVIDSRGAITDRTSNPRIRSTATGREFILAWSEETAIGEDIVISQRDVREVQKAKAAIETGWLILLKHYGARVEDLSKVLVAGAFGTYINPESAKIIGLIPDIPSDRVVFLGNTAGSGARLILKNNDEMNKAIDNIDALIVWQIDPRNTSHLIPPLASLPLLVLGVL